jgi:AraC-like DNA-binding protein
MPFSTVHSTADPEIYRQTIRPAGEYLVTGRGQFAGNVTKVDLHHLRMQRYQENLPRTWCVPMLARSAVWFLTAPGSVAYVNGVEARGDYIALVPPDTTTFNRSTGPLQAASMSLPTEDMARLSIALTGRDLTPRLGMVSLLASSPLLDRLRRLHEAASRLAATAPEIIASSDAARGLEKTLVDAMFDCLTQGGAQEDASSRGRHHAIAKRFRAFVEKNPEEPLYIADVCAATGVNKRTLHLCCQEQLGVGPKRYLMLRRMHLARRALAGGPANALSVTEIATRYGFWELGRFAVNYRAIFGESPSATLHRARLDRTPGGNPPICPRSATPQP